MWQAIRSFFAFHQKRRGAFIALTPFIVMALIGLAAIAVDIGSMRIANAQLKNLTDSASLAGVNELRNGNDAAIRAAYTVANENNAFKSTKTLNENGLKNVVVELGVWDKNAQQFIPTPNSPDAVRVTASASKSVFFTSLYGADRSTFNSQSIAIVPEIQRDIIFLVELSTSMASYSNYFFVPPLTEPTVTANLRAIYDAMNMPQLGNMTWATRRITGTNSYILNQLGLTGIPYPYPVGGWNSYINWVKGFMGTTPGNVGLLYQYGYQTLVAFIVAQRVEYRMTPVLWKTPVQPLQAVKDSIRTFTSRLSSSNDRIALVTFNSINAMGARVSLLEQDFSNNLNTVSAILDGDPVGDRPGRQPGHYIDDNAFNGAINFAIDQFLQNGRPEAEWIIYIFSIASVSDFRAYQNEVARARDNGIIVNAIGFRNITNERVLGEIQTTGGTIQIVPAYTTFNGTLLNMLNNKSTNPRNPNQASAQLVR